MTKQTSNTKKYVQDDVQNNKNDETNKQYKNICTR